MTDIVWIHFALPRTAWYALDEADRNSLEQRWASVGDRFRESGASGGAKYHVRGQGDFSTVEVWHFPDVDAAFRYWSELTASSYLEWFSASNSFGPPVEAQS
jgi:hypothetical protein